LCKRSMMSVLPRFNSQRMLKDYTSSYYGPAARQSRELAADDFAGARELAAWKEKVRAAWPGVELSLVRAPADRVAFDEPLEIEVEAKLNGLDSQDLLVELVLDRMLGSEQPRRPPSSFFEADRPRAGVSYIGDREVLIATFERGEEANGACRYRLQLDSPWPGRLSYEIRAVPQHRHLPHRYGLGLMRWL